MKAPLKVGIALLALVAAAVVGYRNFGSLNPEADAIDAKLTHWLCGEAECGNAFSITSGELRRSGRAGAEFQKCPKCSKMSAKAALPCPFCKEYSFMNARGKFPSVCPKCGKRNRVDPHDDIDAKAGHG